MILLWITYPSIRRNVYVLNLSREFQSRSIAKVFEKNKYDIKENLNFWKQYIYSK